MEYIAIRENLARDGVHAARPRAASLWCSTPPIT